jgi:hypothetical protein
MQSLAHPTLCVSTFFKGLIKRQNTAAYMATWQHLPASMSLALKLVGLIITRKYNATYMQAKKSKKYFTDAPPPHYHRPTKLGPSH